MFVAPQLVRETSAAVRQSSAGDIATNALRRSGESDNGAVTPGETHRFEQRELARLRERGPRIVHERNAAHEPGEEQRTEDDGRPAVDEIVDPLPAALRRRVHAVASARAINSMRREGMRIMCPARRSRANACAQPRARVLR